MSRGASTSPATTPERPQLKPWYRLADDGCRIVLEYAHSVVVFEGRAARRLLPALLPLLDGTRTIAEIAAAFPDAAAPAVDHAVAMLAAKGLLTAGPPIDERVEPVARETAQLLAATSHSSQRPAAVHDRLRSARVGVAGGSPVVHETARLLLRSGVGYVERVESEEPRRDGLDAVVFLASARDVPSLPGWNGAMLATATPWLQVLPHDGRFAAVGPLFLPYETCCYECYRLRRASTIGYREEHRVLDGVEAPFPSPVPVGAAAAAVAAILLLRWIGLEDSLVPGRLYALELGPTFALTTHHVYRVPRCPACSGLEAAAAPLPWFKEGDAVRC